MGIFDRFRSTPPTSAGNPELATSSPAVTFGEVATRASAEGASMLMDMLQVLPDPDPVLRKAGLDIQAYRELLVDEHLGAVVDTRKDAVRELEWQIDRSEGVAADQADMIEAMLKELDMYQIITEILDAPLFGRQPMEVMWEERVVDGVKRLWLKDIIGKPPEWFACTTHNEWRYLDRAQTFGSVGVPLKPRKFVIATHDARYTNPYGVATLSRCFWPVTFAKDGGIKSLVTHIEKYGMPWVQLTHNEDAGTEFANDLLKLARTMRLDGVFVMPNTAEMTIIPNGQKSSADMFIQLVELCQDRISKAILGHAAAADTTPGKLGNEEGAMSAKWGRAASDRRLVEGVMNEIIYWVWELNWNVGEPPRFMFYEEEDVDQATAQRDIALNQIGVRLTDEYVMKVYGLDRDDFVMIGGSSIAFDTVGGLTAQHQVVKDYEARLLSRQGAYAVLTKSFKVPPVDADEMLVKELPPLPTTPPPPGAAFAEGDGPPASPDPTQSVIDTAAEKASASDKPVDELTREVLRLIDVEQDYPGAIEAIQKAFPKMSSEELEADLVKRLFAADTTGRLSAEDEGDA